MDPKEGRQSKTVYGIAILGTLAALLAVFYVALLLTAEPGKAMPGAGPVGSHVLVVLPFVPMSPGEGDAAFGIGLADSIILRLSRVSGLTVRPLSVSLAAASETDDPVEAARRARAGVALGGRYRRSGDTIRLTAQVLDAEGGFVIWARDLEADVEGLVPAEEALAAAAASALVPGTIEDGRLDAGDLLGENANAHYLWLLARGKLATRQSGLVAEAVGLLEQAIILDPGFARAHALLAEASTGMFLAGVGGDRSWVDRGIMSARRAIYLDDKDPAGHFSLGQALLMKGDPVEAAREMVHALALDPAHAPALQYLAILLNTVGMGESFPEVVRRLEAADPSMDLGWILLRQSERDGQVDQLRERLEGELRRRRDEGITIEPTAMQLGILAYMTGDAACGLRWAARLEQVSSNRSYIEIINLLAQARLGNRDAVFRIVEGNRTAFAQDWDYAGLVARGLGALGETDATLEWLSLSAAAGSCDAWGFENLPEFEHLRDDPRFLAAYGVVKGRAEGIAELLRDAGYR